MLSRFGFAVSGLLMVAILAPGAMAATTYSAQLSWAIPTQRDNGQALAAADISGYEVYYTADDPARSGAVKVNGGATASVSVSNLAAGKYYFTIAAVDRSGLKSQLSNMVASEVGAPQNTGSGSTGSGGAVAAPNANYSVSLSWTAPTQRTNGKALPLSQLAGYELRYVGGTPAVNKVVRINGAANNRYVAAGLTPGSYKFTIAAIDTGGASSAGSNSVTKTIKASNQTSSATGSGSAGTTTGSGATSGGGSAGGSASGAANSGGSGTTAGSGSVNGGTSGTGTAGTGTTGGSATGTNGGTTTIPVSYTAQLSWDIPSQRENGQPLPLSELAGYEVYYTTDNPALSGSIKISGGGTAKVSVPNLAAGQYYFTISAIDTTGLKSALSALAPARFGP